MLSRWSSVFAHKCLHIHACMHAHSSVCTSSMHLCVLRARRLWLQTTTNKMKTVTKFVNPVPRLSHGSSTDQLVPTSCSTEFSALEPPLGPGSLLVPGMQRDCHGRPVQLGNSSPLKGWKALTVQLDRDGKPVRSGPSSRATSRNVSGRASPRSISPGLSRHASFTGNCAGGASFEVQCYGISPNYRSTYPYLDVILISSLCGHVLHTMV